MLSAGRNEPRFTVLPPAAAARHPVPPPTIAHRPLADRALESLRRASISRPPKPLPELRLCATERRLRLVLIKSIHDLIYLIDEPIILHMAKDWQVLIRLGAGSAVEIMRARLVEQDVVVEGPFELPPLARLSSEDQTFVAAFVCCHGSIKQMEQLFGVSYPTIKNRLNRVGALLPFVEVAPEPTPPSASELLTRLERGELSVEEVLNQLRRQKESS